MPSLEEIRQQLNEENPLTPEEQLALDIAKEKERVKLAKLKSMIESVLNPFKIAIVESFAKINTTLQKILFFLSEPDEMTYDGRTIKEVYGNKTVTYTITEDDDSIRIKRNES